MTEINYGTDVRLAHHGIAAHWPLLKGPKVVLFNIFRRITTAPELPAYGGNSIDLRDYCGEQLDPSALGSIEKDIFRVCSFEERASNVRATVQYDVGESSLIISVFVSLETKTFKMVVKVTSLTAEIIDAANLG